MYSKYLELKDIISYSPKHNFVVDKKGALLNFNLIKINKHFKFSNIISFGKDLIIASDIRGNSIILNTTTNLCDDRFKIEASQYPYLSIYEFKDEEIEGVFNYETQELLFKATEWIGRDIIGEKILSEYQGKIICRNLNSGLINWQFNVEELGTWLYKKKEERPYKVDKFIGVYKNQLLISCFSGLIISLHINTGELLHQWSQYPNELTMNEYRVSAINPSYCSMLDEAEGILVGFSFFTLWKVNLETGVLTTFNLKEEFEKEDLLTINQVMGFVVTDTHYIISAKTTFKESINRSLDCLISVHKQNHTIDWKHQFKETEALKKDIPQYAKGKLYQLDWDNTLHIFEKES